VATILDFGSGVTAFPFFVAKKLNKDVVCMDTDGSFAGSQSSQYSMPGAGAIPPRMQARQGRWSVVGIDDNDFILRLAEQGSGPVDVKVHILDQNTWQNSDNLNTWYRQPN